MFGPVSTELNDLIGGDAEVELRGSVEFVAISMISSSLFVVGVLVVVEVFLCSEAGVASVEVELEAGAMVFAAAAVVVVGLVDVVLAALLASEDAALVVVVVVVVMVDEEVVVDNIVFKRGTGSSTFSPAPESGSTMGELSAPPSTTALSKEVLSEDDFFDEEKDGLSTAAAVPASTTVKLSPPPPPPDQSPPYTVKSIKRLQMMAIN